MRILIILLLLKGTIGIAQKPDTIFYSNGKIFSITKGERFSLQYLHFKLNQEGDTLDLVDDNYIGDLSGFESRSYCKNIDGETTYQNGDGIYNYYRIDGDSLFIDESYEVYNSSMFFQLRESFNLESKHFLELDSIFIEAFKNRKKYTKEEFIDELVKNTQDLEISDSLNLMPYISIASDMLFDSWENKRRVKDLRIPIDELPRYFKLFNNKVKSLEELSLAFEYHRHQGELPKGEWLYYSGMTRFLKPHVSEQCLMNSYQYSMARIVSVSNVNIKTNKMFAIPYLKLAEIIDTLGNDFEVVKGNIIENFIESLTSEELETIRIVSSRYEKVISDYYDEFVEDNRNRTGGIDINRVKYYELITHWQLKFPNCKLFNQHNREQIAHDRWRTEEFPSNFESILERFDNFLDEGLYAELAISEQRMFDSLEGFDNYLTTPFNPYFLVKEKKKRKFRRFNWLVKLNSSNN